MSRESGTKSNKLKKNERGMSERGSVTLLREASPPGVDSFLALTISIFARKVFIFRVKTFFSFFYIILYPSPVKDQKLFI